MIATGVYFNNLGQTYENSTNMVSGDSDDIRNITIHVINTPSDSTEDDNDDNLPSWWLLPVLQIYTFFYNIGLGSLTWTVATEILPPRYAKQAERLKSRKRKPEVDRLHGQWA